MRSDEIIDLDPPSDDNKSQTEEEDNNLGESVNNSKEGCNGEEADDPDERDMDLSDDIVIAKKKPGADLIANVCMDSEASGSKNLTFEQSPVTGVKRARVEYTDNDPSVRVIYSSLTRESKRKLMELMQQWSEWHAKHQSSLKESKENALESGEETYYPALHTVSFWLDNQARVEECKEDGSVPIYDREFRLGSASADGIASFERIEKEESRCFNCGSYSHSLKECPKPRDHLAISNARKIHNEKKSLANANRGQNRYYKKTPGKFDDLRAGVLGPETRQCLGIGEYDPPPWLHRMRELGYPPGYLDIEEDEDEPSGIKLFIEEGEERESNDEQQEEGELPETAEPVPPKRKMSVEFPGINAPIPDNADHRLWSVNPPTHVSSSRTQNRPHHNYRLPEPDPVYPSRYYNYNNNSNNSREQHYDTPPTIHRNPNLDRSWSDRDGRREQERYDYRYSTSSPDFSSYHERDRERYDFTRHHHRK